MRQQPGPRGRRVGAACAVGPEARPQVWALPTRCPPPTHTCTHLPQCFHRSVPREDSMGPRACHPGRRARRDLTVHILSARARRKHDDGELGWPRPQGVLPPPVPAASLFRQVRPHCCSILQVGKLRQRATKYLRGLPEGGVLGGAACRFQPAEALRGGEASPSPALAVLGTVL